MWVKIIYWVVFALYIVTIVTVMSIVGYDDKKRSKVKVPVMFYEDGEILIPSKATIKAMNEATCGCDNHMSMTREETTSLFNTIKTMEKPNDKLRTLLEGIGVLRAEDALNELYASKWEDLRKATEKFIKEVEPSESFQTLIRGINELKKSGVKP